MSKKPIIAVDADDTLFDENNAMRLFHNERYGTDHSVEDYLQPGPFFGFWERIWDVNTTEHDKRYKEFIEEHKRIHNLQPLDHALEVLLVLKKQYDFVIVTARNEHDVDMTRQALDEHYPNIFTDVHFVPLWKVAEGKADKGIIGKAIGADYFIDDSFENCVLTAAAGIQTLVFGKYGWNQEQELRPNMVRVNDWKAVQEYFNEQR